MLSVSHRQQRTQSDCLPICAQMVLAYLGLMPPYKTLTSLLDTRHFGTPFRNLKRLEKLGTSVTFDHCGIGEIAHYTQNNSPVIVALQTADLKYWAGIETDHVVVVIGIDVQSVYVHDPSLDHGPHPVPHSQFELAQLKFDNICAVIQL